MATLLVQGLSLYLGLLGTRGNIVHPQGLPAGHNGGVTERLVQPRPSQKPHIIMILWDDYGWASAGWHRNYSMGGVKVEPTQEVRTDALDQLVREGMELDRAYVFKCCSPTRSAVQSGRHPHNVNVLNMDMDISNPEDPVSGFAAIPRNMTGIATKMAAGGYRTAMFGKWDAGMATPDHTPDGRGYQSGMWYFHHDNDYWSMSYQKRCNGQAITDLWRKEDSDSQGWGALSYNNTCSGMQGVGGRPRKCLAGRHGDHWFGGYEDALFEQQLLGLIQSHDPQVPLFVFWAPHVAHGPLQVPDSFASHFDFITSTDLPSHPRQNYAAMVQFADHAVGNVTDALRAKGMWDNTLIVFMSDNGGWVSKEGMNGGNNYPLKGGKYSNWEGGIRSNSFVSGGFLPPSRRGIKYEGLVTAWDWYATFAAFAGVDTTDHRAALAGLPPVDGLDMSEVLLGLNLDSPRKEVPIGAEPRVVNLASAKPCKLFSAESQYDGEWELPVDGSCSTVVGLISDEDNGLWKVILGDESQYVGVGPAYPNTSTPGFDSQSKQYVRNCGHGCLFELRSDPTENNDLAQQLPEKVDALRARIETYAASSFNPQRGRTDPAACDYAVKEYGGFWGPFIDAEGGARASLELVPPAALVV